jgi:Fe-S-cluster containining protein
VSDNLWYSSGLKFACTGCGNCCTGAPGYVWIGEAEALRLAEHLALPFDEFARRYLRFAKGRISLVEKRNGDCVFWSATAGCEVYESRPDLQVIGKISPRVVLAVIKGSIMTWLRYRTI